MKHVTSTPTPATDPTIYPLENCLNRLCRPRPTVTRTRDKCLFTYSVQWVSRSKSWYGSEAQSPSNLEDVAWKLVIIDSRIVASEKAEGVVGGVADAVGGGLVCGESWRKVRSQHGTTHARGRC